MNIGCKDDVVFQNDMDKAQVVMFSAMKTDANYPFNSDHHSLHECNMMHM